MLNYKKKAFKALSGIMAAIDLRVNFTKISAFRVCCEIAFCCQLQVGLGVYVLATVQSVFQTFGT